MAVSSTNRAVLPHLQIILNPGIPELENDDSNPSSPRQLSPVLNDRRGVYLFMTNLKNIDLQTQLFLDACLPDRRLYPSFHPRKLGNVKKNKYVVAPLQTGSGFRYKLA
jgi:hypothetical protein